MSDETESDGGDGKKEKDRGDLDVFPSCGGNRHEIFNRIGWLPIIIVGLRNLL